MNHPFLNMLVCPTCKTHLHYSSQKQELICKEDRLAYPIKADIPVILPEYARPLSLEECKNIA